MSVFIIESVKCKLLADHYSIIEQAPIARLAIVACWQVEMQLSNFFLVDVLLNTRFAENL